MEEGPEIWRALGIARTRDRQAIRVAYVRRLASIDVTSAAMGYVGLRLAYETALAWAQGLSLVGSWQDGAEESDTPREHARAETWFAFDLPPRAEWLPDGLMPELAELDRLFATVAADKRRWLMADEKLDLRRCWSAIATDANPATERAVRWLIANWGPWAVGLAAFAGDHFNWGKVDDATAADGTIGEALWRYRGIQFLQRVRRPDHPYHSAWAELTSDYFEGSSRGRANPQMVHELQAVARHVWPEVETEFTPGRVALWKNNTADPAHPDNPRQESQLLKTLGKIAVALVMLRIAFFVFSALFAALGFVVSNSSQ